MVDVVVALVVEASGRTVVVVDVATDGEEQAASNEGHGDDRLEHPDHYRQPRPVTVAVVSLRFSLRQPGSEPVVLDVAGESWAEPEGHPEEHIGQELWALPGLVDAHAHFAAAEGASWVSAGVDGAAHNARRALEAGVMLALDKGWSDLTVIEMLALVVPGDRPDVDAAGVVIAVDGGYLREFANEIDPADIANAVALASKEGNGWVKLIGDWPRQGLGPVANFSEEELATAVESRPRPGGQGGDPHHGP